MKYSSENLSLKCKNFYYFVGNYLKIFLLQITIK